MTFLPEDDADYLRLKGIEFEEVSEQVPNGGTLRAIQIPEFPVPDNLFVRDGTNLIRTATCELRVHIPDGYPTTKLDSFYTLPPLYTASGVLPDRANMNGQAFNGRVWQFWSRHLEDSDWRPGVDGLEMYLNHIHADLRRA